MITLIIDKHPVIRKGLTLILKNHFPQDAILAFADLKVLRETFPDLTPDLIILGVGQHPEIDNVDFIHEAENQFPKCAIIVNDQIQDGDMASAYLRAGGSAYISKENEIEEILTCINHVANGQQYVNRSPAKTANTQSIKNGQYNKPDKQPVHLARREFEIANLLTKGFKTSEIARLLGKKPSTISTQKTNIFQKLRVNNVIMLKEMMVANEVLMIDRYSY